MGKWLNKFKNPNICNSRADNVDILATTSTLSALQVGISENSQPKSADTSPRKSTLSVPHISFLSAKPIHANNSKAPNVNANNVDILENVTILGVATKELQDFLGEDFGLYENNPEALKAAAELLQDKRLMDKGKAPQTFTASTYCKACRRSVPIPSSLICASHVLECLWCLNRAKGLPMPPLPNVDLKPVIPKNEVLLTDTTNV